jgi:hypothetical protein
MECLEAAIKSSQNPDELYGNAFGCFRSLFGLTNRDISRLQLPSYLPAALYGDPVSLGAVITAALMAMLDRREHTGGETLALADVSVYVNCMAVPKSAEHMDQIILEQVSISGVGLLASDLVKSRVHYWERNDYRKFKRWLRALAKAARVHQGMTPAPLNDPFQRDAKEQAVRELTPFVERLQAKFEEMNRIPTKNEIIDAFESEAVNHRWLEDNLGRWREFVRTNPMLLVHTTAADLFDHFAAFVTMHEPEYTRKKLSSGS